MKKRIILEHRQALDAMERADTKHSSCRRRGTCSDKKDCLDCPAYIEKMRCKVILDEKSKVLKKLNDQIVIQNDSYAERQRKESLKKRKRREEKRRINAQKPQKLHITVEQAEKLQLKREGLNKIMPTNQNFNRKDLTVVRYQAHKNEDGMSDDAIAKLYSIPKGSFPKIKRDLLATVEVELGSTENNEIVLQQKLNQLELEYAKVQDSYQALQTSHSQQKEQFDNISNELALSQEMNIMRQDMIKELENDLNESQSSITAPGDSNNEDYKALYEHSLAKCTETEKERDHYKHIANDTALAFENYQKEIEALIYKRDKQDEQTIEAFNKQMNMFRSYEKLVLERLLQELNRN